MDLKVLAVFDKKTATYGQPFTVRHVGEALRDWDHLRKDSETKFGKNPEDFDLFQTATYNEEFGAFQNLTPPVHLASGV